MADTTQPTLIYLEPDDEITAAIRRLREAEPGRVVLVAPGRSKATSSVVALRLLGRLSADDGREVAVVGDALTRSLAAEADLRAYASVPDAVSSTPSAAAPPPRAAIHVVRPEEPDPVPTAATAPPMAAVTAAYDDDDSAPAFAPALAPLPEPAAGPSDATQVVRVPDVAPASRPAPRAARERSVRRRERRRTVPLVVLGVATLLLVGAGVAAGVVLLPAATVRLTPATATIGPAPYPLRFEQPQSVAGTATASATGSPTGEYVDLVAATGSAAFRNFNNVPVEVPAGTQVSADDIGFETTAAVTVPPGGLNAEGRIVAGEAAAPVAALAAGPSGNVAAEAIDTVETTRTRNALRAFPQNTARLVINYEATGGGVDAAGTEVLQTDVDAAVAAVDAELRDQVTEQLAQLNDMVTADLPPEPAAPAITYQEGLVGARDLGSFDVSGTLPYDRAGVALADIEAAARDQVAADPALLPAGHELLVDTIQISVQSATREGPALVVTVAITGQSVALVDVEAIRERVAGRSIEEAEATLAEVGTADIQTWPDWVEELPNIPWRISVEIRSEGASPAPAAPASSPAAP